MYTRAKSLWSCPTLCDPMGCSRPGSSVRGILQARILEWVAVPSSRDLPYPGIVPASLMSPALAGRFFTASATWEALKWPTLGEKKKNTLRKYKQKLKRGKPRLIAQLYSKPVSTLKIMNCACNRLVFISKVFWLCRLLLVSH